MVLSQCGVIDEFHFLCIFPLLFHSSATGAMHMSMLQVPRGLEKPEMAIQSISKAHLIKTPLFNNTNLSPGHGNLDKIV